MDGEIGGMIADEDFPQAARINIMQQSSVSEFFVNISTKKVDIAFASPEMFLNYNKGNLGKIHKIPTATPLRVFANTLAIPSGEDKLRRMLDIATDELISNGVIEKILRQHAPYSDTLLRVQPNYIE